MNELIEYLEEKIRILNIKRRCLLTLVSSGKKKNEKKYKVSLSMLESIIEDLETDLKSIKRGIV